MTLFQLTLKNLFRRRTRTGLTVMGIGVGIGAVVALLGLAWGLKESWDDALKVRGTDLVVRNASGGLVAQPFDETIAKQVKATPGVAATAALLVEVLSVEEASTMVVSGREWGSYLWQALDVVEGRLPKNKEEKAVVLGTLAAEMLHKKPGDKITIEVEELDVVGIVDGHAVVENGAIILAINQLQAAVGKDGKANFINVRLVDRHQDPSSVAKTIQAGLPGFRADLAEDVSSQNDGFKTFEAMSWGTSAIAIIVGTFGVMNTMLMSVFERTKEIGILIALGWRRARILRMILWESITLCGGAAIVGLLFGFVTLKLLAVTPLMSGRLEPYFGVDLVLLALGLALAVGLASGLYPAFHCTRIHPSEALRQG